MVDLKDYISAAIAVAAIVFGWRQYRALSLRSGLWIESTLSRGIPRVRIHHQGQDAAYGVEVRVVHGSLSSATRLPGKGTLMRDGKKLAFLLVPDTRGRAAIRVSYQRAVHGGTRMVVYWDAVEGKRRTRFGPWARTSVPELTDEAVPSASDRPAGVQW